jgi:hypothetical protein
MPTLIVAVTKLIREVLGEAMATRFDDSSIEQVVKTMIRLNKIRDCSLSPDQKTILQNFNEGSNELRLLALYSAKHLILPDRSLPGAKDKLFEIDNEIHKLENYT